MLVQQILKGKPQAGILTVSPDATVAEAAVILARHRIGSVVVSANGEVPDGMLSERDIVRELAGTGPACLSGKVSEYMTARVETCTTSASAQELLERMTEGRFRHIPVVEDGRMVGLVSIGDVIKALLSETAMEKKALERMIMGR
ncbi:CBS domain-containing protein [Pontibaca methylaminivorans]|uniref:CBS domain-containing protein n=1 Tax=Pontibaca methylaminivorans TaxID=515897 RepID=A0A1R3WDP2_9RHOB|nr:CBS domain-containing protein [Pontibaca methylaminivorans]SIT76010.1 CBS domain-containing protein [Pontibaca methylaminivorans]